MEKRYYVVVTGTAGSGKTTLVHNLSEWMNSQKISVTTINLDPAVEWIPYSPDIDVREYVSAKKVAEQYSLGPNGALVASIDMLHNYTENIRSELTNTESLFTLIDTPGQIELFAYRESSLSVLNQIINPYTTVVLFLIDSTFLTSFSKLISLLMLSISVQLRLELPQINIISKSDLLDPQMLEIIEKINESQEIVKEFLLNEDNPYAHFIEKIADITIEEGFKLIPVSTKKEDSIWNLFGEIQGILGIEEGIETSI